MYTSNRKKPAFRVIALFINFYDYELFGLEEKNQNYQTIN